MIRLRKILIFMLDCVFMFVHEGMCYVVPWTVVLVLGTTSSFTSTSKSAFGVRLISDT